MKARPISGNRAAAGEVPNHSIRLIFRDSSALALAEPIDYSVGSSRAGGGLPASYFCAGSAERRPFAVRLFTKTRFTVALRPRKNKFRQDKYHRCSKCGGQVRKRSFRCKKCSQSQR